MGKNAANEKRDVKLVQIYLNLFKNLEKIPIILTEDGLIGTQTIGAIEEFQFKSVGMTYPDGRVDPNGKTFRYLTMYLDSSEQDIIEQQLGQLRRLGKAAPSLSAATVRSRAGLSSLYVTYSGVRNSRKVVSSYSMDVIKLALKQSGMDKAVITSTFRTPEEQASIMLRNAKKDLASQYRLYGQTGDAVLKHYENNKNKPDSEIVALMVREIDEQSAKGRRVSKHCVPESTYQKLNIIDIGLNSTRSASQRFNSRKFTAALADLVKEGYIDKLIDETGKSNACWHIEIKPNKKSISDYDNGSILLPAKHLTGSMLLC